MMRNRAFFLINVVLVLIFLSCKKEDNLNNFDKDYPFVLKATDSLKITFNDSTALYFPGAAWNYNDSSFSLSNVGASRIKINHYSFNTNNWSQTILKLEGPTGVKNQGGFVVKNDTLIFSPAGFSNLYQFHLNGDLISKTIYGEREVSFNIREWNPQFYKNGSLIGFSTAEYEAVADDPETYKQSKLYTLVDIKNDSVNHIITYPEEFQGNIWSSNDNGYTALNRGDSIIMNFAKSHYLYIYDLEGNLLSKKIAKDDLVDDATPMKSDNPDLNGLIHEVGGHYNKLIYDEHRKVYYRTSIAYQKDEVIKKPTRSDLMGLYEDKKLCVTVLNEDFEVITQRYFRGHQGGLGDVLHFVRPDGLYLWYLHKNMENEENFIKFNLVKNEKYVH